jgi:DNA-binding PadR family transcriptional regulator
MTARRPALPMSPTAYQVLLTLGDDTLHGYAIMRRFEELTQGADELLPGTLYTTLGRMVELGWIEEAPPPRGEESSGPPRRHYRITPQGRKAAKTESERIRRLVAVVKQERPDWLPERSR